MEQDFPHTLYHNDLSELPLGSLPFQDAIASQHLSSTGAALPGGLMVLAPHAATPENAFRGIERGTGKYIEALGASAFHHPRFVLAGDGDWHDIRLRAVITPLDPDSSDRVPAICGVVARFVDANNYVALLLDRDRQLKLVQVIHGQETLLEARPLEFCLGQSLTLTLRVVGNHAHGTAGPYTGSSHVRGTLDVSSGKDAGRAGYISAMPARFGPFTVESTPDEAKRLETEQSQRAAALKTVRAKFPRMKLERTVALQGLVNGRNLRIVDINRDGKPEILLAQGSPDLAQKLSMTRLTCLTAMTFDGKILWQAGVPDPNAPLASGDLPFQVHDLYGDGGKVVVCVFGFDVQVRDGKSGRVLFSAETPKRAWVGDDYKQVTGSFGAKWGDESLNMDVASLAFCSTLGNGSREIIVQDDFHGVAVLDALSDPPLQPLFRYRGNHGRFPFVADVNGDGKDEILAGYGLLAEAGKVLASLPLSDFAHAAAVLDPMAPGGASKRAIIAGGREGLILADVAELLAPGATSRGRNDLPAGIGGYAARLSIARFRADIPGLQIAVVGGFDNAGVLSLYDACGRRLWSRALAPSHGVLATPVNWTGRGEELLLASVAPGSGLFDGHGQCVVEAPASGPFTCSAVASGYCADGRDAIIAWDAQNLAVYVPDDAPKADAYRPVRLGAENASNFKAQVSLPPGW